MRERYFKLITITCAFFRGKFFSVFACTKPAALQFPRKGVPFAIKSKEQVCDFMRVFRGFLRYFSDTGEFRDFPTSLLPF